MKKFLLITAIVALAGFLAGDKIRNQVQAKDRTSEAVQAAQQIDGSYNLLPGQRGYYQLRDSEGGVSFNSYGQLVPFGRKVPAYVAGLEFEHNLDGSLATNDRGGFIPRRGPDGTIVVCVHVLRPADKGGSFDVCGAEYGSREPGGFDIVQVEDLRGI